MFTFAIYAQQGDILLVASIMVASDLNIEHDVIYKHTHML